MFSLSSSLIKPAPTEHQWRSDNNSIIHDQNHLFHFSSDRIDDSNLLHLPPLQPQLIDPGLPRQGGSSGSGGYSVAAKKLNHNASERDRRKKINYLYHSLRSLLPIADQLKKLSNPATVARMVKYIPELRQQVEALTRKKEEIKASMKNAETADEVYKEQEKKMTFENCFWTVFTNRLSEKEIMIQLSTKDDHHRTEEKKLSEMLVLLEKDGLLLLNASSFNSHQGRLFFNLHLQVDGNYSMEAETLGENLSKQAFFFLHKSLDYNRIN